jgi:hypothetical protein
MSRRRMMENMSMWLSRRSLLRKRDRMSIMMIIVMMMMKHMGRGTKIEFFNDLWMIGGGRWYGFF